jgi:hypothetical protein
MDPSSIRREGDCYRDKFFDFQRQNIFMIHTDNAWYSQKIHRDRLKSKMRVCSFDADKNMFSIK